MPKPFTLFIVQPTTENLTIEEVCRLANLELKALGALGSEERVEQCLGSAMLKVADQTGYWLTEDLIGDFVLSHASISKAYLYQFSEKGIEPPCG